MGGGEGTSQLKNVDAGDAGREHDDVGAFILAAGSTHVTTLQSRDMLKAYVIL